MNITRFLLAISVVLVHIHPLIPKAFNGYIILPGLIAVQCFFIISGFFMALIINEKYSKAVHPYFSFIKNRFLRIYPIYWFVLILMVGYELLSTNIGQEIVKHNSLPDLAFYIYLIIKNITLIINLGHIFPVEINWGGLVVFQAWSLVIEVSFYIIAPFLVKRRLKVILVLSFLAFIMRAIILRSPIYPPISAEYYFLPNFVFFCLGILSYKLSKLPKYNSIPSYIKISSVLIFFLYTFVFVFLPEFHRVKDLAYFGILTLIIPFLLKVDTKINTKILGDLSYPIYISHILIFSVMNSLNIKSAYLDLTLIIAFSFLLDRFIAKPIDSIRTVKFKKTTAEDIE